VETVLLGRTGVRVSPLAFGTMSFGGDADTGESARLFARCRDAGINHFDTADIYNEGRSEEILGDLVRGCRDEIVLATKAYFPTGPGPNDRGSSRYHLMRAVEGSLRRLRTDRIDICYLHRWDDATDLGETLRALEDIVRSGKVLYPAVSNFSAWQTTKALGVAALHDHVPVVAIQPMYNLLKRQAESEILPMAAHERLGVFPYSPLAGGYLSGKYADGSGLSGSSTGTGRLVTNAMYRTRYGAESNAGIARSFAALAREMGHHPAALAVAWVASHPAVTAPLLGARSVAQLDDLLGAAGISPSPDDRARISALPAAPAPATDRNEEGSAHDLRRP